MASLPCPACGASVEFRSAAPYAVCAYCQSLLVRRDVTLESIGKVAEVPEDVSPLQLQTGGVFEGKHFTLIGRIRKAWEAGSWSEWCALFDDQRMGWLAEAQGDLVMTFEQPFQPNERPKPDWLRRERAGQTLPLMGRPFTITDRKTVVCLGAEGELTEDVSVNTAMTSVDLRGKGLQFATVEVLDNDMHLFVGRFVEFAECRFTHLRRLDGWQ